MNIQQIFDLAIKLGMENDLRGKSAVLKNLKRTKDKYEKMSKEEREDFDVEKLVNPYADSRILHDTKKEIKKVLVGIDMEGPELLLAKDLGVDLVIAHHPEGKGLADLSDVMHLQAEVLAQYGIPINIAESVLRPRISEVSRGVNAINHNRAVDFARILNIGFMNAHTPCDNLVAKFIFDLLEKNKSKLEYVDDVLKLLKSIPEYALATKIEGGPTLFAGSRDNRCGKIAVTEITGGTEGSPEIYEKMAHAGIGTTIGMHLSEKHKDAAEKAHINAIVAGHMSSDSLGVNLFLDELEKRGIEIIPCSGLIRVSRIKKGKK
jgi:putative NIF3 family GTP cyclohydrolase 1 type 2